jgi:DNA-binding response OmpR family regulator
MSTSSIVKILLVEDETSIRELLLELLSDDGFDIVEAESGDAACELLGRDDLRLLLTDINMPGRLDGVDLAQRARANYPGLPVVFITGLPDSASRAMAISEPRTVLVKPFQFRNLLTAVRQMASVGEADSPPDGHGLVTASRERQSHSCRQAERFERA